MNEPSVFWDRPRRCPTHAAPHRGPGFAPARPPRSTTSSACRTRARRMRACSSCAQPAPLRDDARDLRRRPALRRHVDRRQLEHLEPSALRFHSCSTWACRATRWGRRHRRLRGTPQPELLTRWLEVAAFQPIFRDHSEKGTDQEPWVHGAEEKRSAGATSRRATPAALRLHPRRGDAPHRLSHHAPAIPRISARHRGWRTLRRHNGRS